MKATPPGWPRISSSLFYDDAAAAIDWLCRTFGFEVRLRIEGEGGRIEHSELVFGDGLIFVGTTGGKSTRPVPLPCKSPRSLGGVGHSGTLRLRRRCRRPLREGAGRGGHDRRTADDQRLRRGILDRSELSRGRSGRAPVVVHAAHEGPGNVKGPVGA